MKITLIIVLILTALLLMSQISLTSNSKKTETVSYEVLAKYTNFEIRKYPEVIVASTLLKGSSYSENSGTGFRKIASYIFGGNESNTKIAMTSPVLMEMNEQTRMSFYMPADYNLSKLPIPTNSDVIIHKDSSKIVAAIEFSGWASDEILQKKFIELKAQLDKENIKYQNSFSYLGYNPPFQVINRKNELIIKLIDFNK